MHTVPFWLLIPFVIMLLSIAVAPLVAERWWENNINKLWYVIIISVPTTLALVFCGLGGELFHQVVYDYIPFIVLLTALFVVTGGIRLHCSSVATPAVNTTMLFLGYALASFVGTTGAAMLLIRPLLEMNRDREHKVHTVFVFIALVANCGGILTPLGDPPLFLLYLRGAPFSWFMDMYPQWVAVGVLLLAGYYVYDSWRYHYHEAIGVRPHSHYDDESGFTINIRGAKNFVFLGGIVMCVAFINPSTIPAMAEADAPIYLKFLREIALLAIIYLSLHFTKRQIREDNHFSWEPIAEVAIIFVGIFVTMTPALIYLNQNAQMFGLTTPREFFYCAGLLSSFLDNAPTAVAFHTVASGLKSVGALVAGVDPAILRAISMGAVYFGSLTYIGNGPNFMVKAIAEKEGVKMPSFFGYILLSVTILLPVYAIVEYFVK
ncbi:MAG: sodium:proton antiporter [Alistipes sp.]|jgi:Na+/H+ antiporter NhaD/arsenite permease-like protein|nr:sodium:proton antiporter [Alistipes sp.]